MQTNRTSSKFLLPRNAFFKKIKPMISGVDGSDFLTGLQEIGLDASAIDLTKKAIARIRIFKINFLIY